MSLRFGRPFFKMSGSGNDFLFFDSSTTAVDEVLRSPMASAASVRALCRRGTGVGADGVVFLHTSSEAHFGIVYFNSDGSRASLCGNASLCTTRLAAELGLAPAAGMTFMTDAGVIAGRIRDGVPEIDLETPDSVDPEVAIPRVGGEQRIGYARAGVPHVVVLCDDISTVDLSTRGSALRWHPAFADGANANFVSRGADGGWSIRTFERGVEGETLACGTGAVAAAALLNQWKVSGSSTSLVTASGAPLVVTLPTAGAQRASLRGEGRLIYRGELAEGLGAEAHSSAETGSW